MKLSASALLLLANRVAGHARFECPPPMSGATGDKIGPCDVRSDDRSVTSFPLKANAFNTVTWLESISHPGAPARFALSGEAGETLEASGFETCLLLDHIPHDAWSKPSYRDESSWHRSSITLWIPDVKCERCYLQLVSVMSDVVHGVPANTKCAYKGALDKANEGDAISEFPACPAVYHSCAPVSINGSIPRNELGECDTKDFEEKLGWPFTPGDNPDLYEYSTYFNRADVGLYSQTDFRLLSVGKPLTDADCTNPIYCDPDTTFTEIMTIPEDATYTSLEGLCAPVTESTVEAYDPGTIMAFVSENNDMPSVESEDPAPATADATNESETEAAIIEEEEMEEIEVSSSVGVSIQSTFYVTTATWMFLLNFLLER